jgi:MFS family permease
MGVLAVASRLLPRTTSTPHGSCVTVFLRRTAANGSSSGSPDHQTSLHGRSVHRPRFYAVQGAISGVGMAVGPLAGALLLPYDFALVALGAAFCFLITFLVTLLFLPPVRVASGDRGLTEGIGLALRNRRFMLFNLLTMGYWFMWVQLSIALPLKAQAVAGTAATVSWVYALNSVMTIVLQYPLIRLAMRRLAAGTILVLGLLLMALGLGLVAFVGDVAALLACVACFSLGALLVAPSQQTVTAELANPAALGSYFGVVSLGPILYQRDAAKGYHPSRRSPRCRILSAGFALAGRRIWLAGAKT